MNFFHEKPPVSCMHLDLTKDPPIGVKFNCPSLLDSASCRREIIANHPTFTHLHVTLTADCHRLLRVPDVDGKCCQHLDLKDTQSGEAILPLPVVSIQFSRGRAFISDADVGDLVEHVRLIALQNCCIIDNQVTETSSHNIARFILFLYIGIPSVMFERSGSMEYFRYNVGAKFCVKNRLSCGVLASFVLPLVRRVNILSNLSALADSESQQNTKGLTRQDLFIGLKKVLSDMKYLISNGLSALDSKKDGGVCLLSLGFDFVNSFDRRIDIITKLISGLTELRRGSRSRMSAVQLVSYVMQFLHANMFADTDCRRDLQSIVESMLSQFRSMIRQTVFQAMSFDKSSTTFTNVVKILQEFGYHLNPGHDRSELGRQSWTEMIRPPLKTGNEGVWTSVLQSASTCSCIKSLFLLKMCCPNHRLLCSDFCEVDGNNLRVMFSASQVAGRVRKFETRLVKLLSCVGSARLSHVEADIYRSNKAEQMAPRTFDDTNLDQLSQFEGKEYYERLLMRKRPKPDNQRSTSDCCSVGGINWSTYCSRASASSANEANNSMPKDDPLILLCWQKSFTIPIESQLIAVNIALAHQISVDNWIAHVVMISKYLLFGNGLFCDEIVDNLAASCRRQKDTEGSGMRDVMDLNLALRNACDNCIPKSDEEARLLAENVTLLVVDDDSTNIDIIRTDNLQGLSVAYKVGWPANLIVDSVCSRLASQISAFLLQLRLISRSLSRLDLEVGLQHRKSLFLARHRMLSFVLALESHVYRHLHEGCGGGEASKHVRLVSGQIRQLVAMNSVDLGVTIRQISWLSQSSIVDILHEAVSESINSAADMYLISYSSYIICKLSDTVLKFESLNSCSYISHYDISEIVTNRGGP